MRTQEFAGERLLLTLWVGSLWSVGYLAIPLAFATLDTPIAAEYAATLLFAVHIIGIASGAMLLITKLFTVSHAIRRSWRFWVLILMLIVTLFFSFYIQPEMAAIKMVTEWRSDALLTEQFNRLHVLSENLYLMLSVLGLVLVVTTDKESDVEGPNGQK